MNLFEIKNHKLVYSPESLSIEPFKVLFSRDTSKDKSKAVAELAAIYHMFDFKSEFLNILDDHQRLLEVISISTDLGKDWKPDLEWNNAADYYKKLQETPSMKLIASAKSAIAKIEKHFNTVDLTSVDKSGKPKYNPKQLADTITMMPKLIASINLLEEQIKKEIEQKNNKLRGGREKGSFAD